MLWSLDGGGGFFRYGKGNGAKTVRGRHGHERNGTTRILGDIRADPAKELLLKNSGVFLKEAFRQR